MSDFETVRNGLQFYPEFDEDIESADAALTALDRIEAEVERLRAARGQQAKTIMRLTDEVERLQGLFNREVAWGEEKLREIERLRAVILNYEKTFSITPSALAEEKV